MADQPQYRSPDPFDKIVGSLEGRGDVVKSASATVTVASPLIGAVQIRRQAGRATAAARKARGESPAFLKGKK